jgi:hypothetical protein
MRDGSDAEHSNNTSLTPGAPCVPLHAHLLGPAAMFVRRSCRRYQTEIEGDADPRNELERRVIGINDRMLKKASLFIWPTTYEKCDM